MWNPQKKFVPDIIEIEKNFTSMISGFSFI